MMKRHALLLVNTGSPDTPEPDAVEQYLQEFLSDKRIVSLPRFFWKPLLEKFILPKRKKISAKRYQSIWTEEGSPLVVLTSKISSKLQTKLGRNWDVFPAMRYGQPSVETLSQELLSRPYERIVVFPLFPQKASQTWGSVEDIVNAVSQEHEERGALQYVRPWYAHPRYIQALTQSVLSSGLDFRKTHLIMSFHGLPSRGAGEYEKQCRETARLLTASLGLENHEVSVAFQSKFGFGKWLGPSLRDVLIEKAKNGKDSVAVICPGFCVDCLETLEEVAIGLKNDFLAHGGKSFTYIPALNDSAEAIELYAELAK